MNDDTKIDPSLGVLGALGPRLRKAMAYQLAIVTAYRTAKRWQASAEEKLRYSIIVPDDEALYHLVLHNLLGMMPESKQRSLRVSVASKTKRRRNVDPWDDGTMDTSEMTLHFDGSRQANVDIAGHKVRVELEQQDKPEKRGGSMMMSTRKRIVLSTRTATGRDAVLEWLDGFVHEMQSMEARMFTHAWGNWRYAGPVPMRGLDSLAYADGIGEDLLADMRRFMEAEDEYEKLGIPWHRGYLVHGPAGTGKTSMAKALASELGLNVYYLMLSDIEHDTDLMSMVSGIQPKSMLLIEDVDVARAAVERDDQHKGVSLSALLNALDGLFTPSGLIAMLSTNQKSRLDATLIRPGRIDRDVEIGYLTQPQFEELVYKLTGVSIPLPDITDAEVAPCDVVDVLKLHIGDGPTGAKAVAERFAEVRDR